MINQKIPINCVTDNISLSDILASNNNVTGKTFTNRQPCIKGSNKEQKHPFRGAPRKRCYENM